MWPVAAGAPMTADRWWSPERHAARRPALLARNRIIAAIRAWLEAGGFVEIETAALQRSPGNELHLHALGTNLLDETGAGGQMYLRTSPEFAAKKLLAAGERLIFEFAKVFRNREGGPINVPEFTMLEWYRADAGYRIAMEDTVDILRAAASAAGVRRLRHRGAETDLQSAPEQLTVAEAFERSAGIDLGATMQPDGTPILAALADASTRAGVRVAADDTWSDVFSRVMAERVEPTLGRERVTLLTDYPAPEAALARRRDDDPRFAERFELFACGVELANGFGELTDALEQRRRFEAAMAEKERIYGERYPIDDDFIAALGMMPRASGVAMGLDRLVMLCVGADRVEDVQWTPVDMGPR
jgi:lysyl-tRNA synthetase class 2